MFNPDSVSKINDVKPSLFSNILKQRNNQRKPVNYFGSTNTASTGGGVIPPQPGGAFSIGVNLSGPQDTFPNFPSVASVGYFVSKGITRFRLPLGWFSGIGIQQSLFAPLDPTYLASLDALLTGGHALGATFMLDIHMFGAGPGGNLSLSGGTSPAAFADLWGKISLRYMNNPAVHAYDLMNEPVNGFDIEVIKTSYQAAINAIRANGDLKPIHCDGINFAAVWNWVSGGSNPSNSSTLYQLTDPANNLRMSGHNYFDRDGSGSHFSWAIETGIAGQAPPGDTVSHNIGVDRLTPFLNWAAAHHVIPTYDEFATSSDFIAAGGNDNYQDWNATLDTTLAFLQANKVECYIWGGGDFAGNYPFGLEPTSTANSLQKDYTSAGLQSTQWTTIDKYTGFSGAQPIAYRIDLPVTVTASGNSEAPIVTPVRYGTSGVASGNFTIRYGGKITSPVVITPTSILMDGTSGGGTFTPSTVTLSPGDNAVAHFTYTPSSNNTFQISATNNAGWINPPLVGYTTLTDNLGTASNLSTVANLRRVVAPYIGPAIRLLRASDGAQQDFYFNNRGDLPRQAIQDWAGDRSIHIARIYNQSGNTNGDIFPIQVNQFGLNFSTANTPILTLVNSDGYPEVTVTSSQWMGTENFSFGQGLVTLVGRAKGAGVLISQDNFNGCFRLGSPFFSVGPDGGGTTVGVGSITNFVTFGGTYSDLYATNNVKGYNAGSVSAQTSVAPFTFNPQFEDADTYINAFRFGGQDFNGSWTGITITFDELSSTVMGNISASDVTYYGITLPDSLSAFTPPVAPAETPFAAPGGTFTPISFKGVAGVGGENGYPVGSNAGGYIYPQNSEIDHWGSKGLGLIRMSVSHRRLQPISYGPLDPAIRTDEVPQLYVTYPAGTQTNLAEIKRVLDRARGNNMYVVIDMHQNTIFDTYAGISRFAGSDAEGTNQFVDWWKRIATKFKNYDNVIWGLMNEPVVSAADNKTAITAVVNAIAAITTTQWMFLPGTFFSGANTWTSHGDAAVWAGYTPPAGVKFAFEAHQYLNAANDGFTEDVVAGKGASCLDQPTDGLLTTWARAHGFKCWLGETGWSANDVQPSGGIPSVEGGAIMHFMTTNSDVWMGWSYWLGGTPVFYGQWNDPGGHYIFSVAPSATEAPQVSILVANE